MGLDEAGGDEAAVEIKSVGFGPDFRFDCGDPAAGHPDVHRRSIGFAACDPRSAQYEVQGHESLLSAGADQSAPAVSVGDGFAPQLPDPPVHAGVSKPASPGRIPTPS